MRLQNIYDITSRHFQFKFSTQDKKIYVLLETGFRIHITKFNREIQPAPSHFTSVLRKHLKSRRLTGLKQPSIADRLVLLEFGDDYRLILESTTLLETLFSLMVILKLLSLKEMLLKLKEKLQWVKLIALILRIIPRKCGSELLRSILDE